MALELLFIYFENGDTYFLEYKGYDGYMAKKGGRTGGFKPKLGYYDFKFHAEIDIRDYMDFLWLHTIIYLEIYYKTLTLITV